MRLSANTKRVPQHGAAAQDTGRVPMDNAPRQGDNTYLISDLTILNAVNQPAPAGQSRASSPPH